MRDGHRDDLDRVVDLATAVQTLHHKGRQDLFLPPDSQALRAYFNRQLEISRLLLLALSRREPLGYLLAELTERPASEFSTGGRILQIHQIAVDPGARRKGIGSMLLKEAVRRAEAEHADAVRLDSWSLNTGAHDFFAKSGFAQLRITYERSLG